MKICEYKECIHLKYKKDRYNPEFKSGESRWCKLYKKWVRLTECSYDGISNYCHKCPHFQGIKTWRCEGGEKEVCNIGLNELIRRDREYEEHGIS